jgi:hypothetical protein
VVKVGTSKEGGTISQQAVVHPWLAADAHGNKTKQTFRIRLEGSSKLQPKLEITAETCRCALFIYVLVTGKCRKQLSGKLLRTTDCAVRYIKQPAVYTVYSTERGLP